MIPKKTLTTLASMTALTLALGQTAVAQDNPAEPTAAAASEAQAAAPEATGSAGGEQSTAKASSAPEPAAAAAAGGNTSAASEAPAEDASAAVPATPATLMEPPAAVQPPPIPPAVAAKREEMEQKFQDRMAERRLRYDELRVRAKEAGIDLPETPPWERQPMAAPPQDWTSYDEMHRQMREQGMQVPESVDLTPQLGLVPQPRMRPEEIEARREERYQQMRERAQARGVELPETPPWKFMTEEERQAHWEKMRSMTPQERMAYREENWQKMRERAREQGVDLPEESPWKQRMEHRQALQDKWKEYNDIVKDMTPEQREAAQAMYGSEPPRGRPTVSPRWGKQMEAPRFWSQGPTGSGPGKAYAPGYGYGAPSYGQGPRYGRGFGPGVAPSGGYGPGAGPYGGQFGGEPSTGAYGPGAAPYRGDYGPGPSYGARPYGTPGYGPDTGYGRAPRMGGPGGWGKEPTDGGRNPY